MAKPSAQSPKKAIFLRYEFTNEAGKLEGGDIYRFATAAEARDMAEEIFKVAASDGVAVNITVGLEKPFMGFLKNVGLDKKTIEEETVEYLPVVDAAAAKAKPVKKTSAKAAPGSRAKPAPRKKK